MRLTTRAASALFMIAVLLGSLCIQLHLGRSDARAAGSPMAALSVLGSQTSMGSASPVTVHIPSPVRPSAGVCSNGPHSQGWLTTNGAWITDHATGCRVRLEGVTWFGMQTQFYVPAGLDFTSYQNTLKLIENLGFNSIRISITDQLVRNNNKIRVEHYIAHAPGLRGLHPLAILDRIIAQAQKDHLWIILDNHSSNAVTISDIRDQNKAIRPLWTGPGYNEGDWINDWLVLAKRYGSGHYCGSIPCANTPTVIGFDLRNEPHTAGAGPWNMKTYLTQGAVWGPCVPALCGNWAKLWKPNTDWAAAATKAANAILGINPRLLMFIEGVQLYPEADLTHPNRADHYWWGSILKGVRADPINLASPAFEQQLVYSPHDWGPWKNQSIPTGTSKASYKSFVNLLAEEWGFIVGLPQPHPLWLGEFDTCNTSPSCARNPQLGSQGWWFQELIQYLKNNPEVGWAYYPINGTNSVDEPSDNSILYKAPGLYDKQIMTALNTVQSAPPQPVKSKALTMLAPTTSIIYGQPIPTIGPLWSGVRTNQKPATVATPATCSTTAGALGSVYSARSYPITCSGGFEPNNTIAYVSGTLRVKRSPVVLSYRGKQSVRQGGTAVLMVVLKSKLGIAIGGRRIGVTLKAANHHTQTCVTTATNDQGQASCTIKPVIAGPGMHTVVMNFAGDPAGHPWYYLSGMAKHRIRVT